SPTLVSAPLATTAMRSPAGDQRGAASERPSLGAYSTCSPLPSAAAVPSTQAPLASWRTKQTRLPSGDQSPSTALGTTRRGSPPRSGTRNSEVAPPSECAKSSVAPSGENRGASSGPPVSAASSPVASSRRQMRRSPSRRETKASVRPSGETAGLQSRPEYDSGR